MTSTTSLENQLEALLSEPVEHGQHRAKSAWDAELRRCAGRIVLFGAGNTGSRVLARLRQDGITPLAFSDNAPSSWGTARDGLPVLSPEDAAAQYGRQSAFVVTICNRDHNFAETQRQLQDLGCALIISAIPLRWKYQETFLPYYHHDLPHKVLEQALQVSETMSLWSDEESRREFLAQVRWRLLGDSSALGPPAPGCQYFPSGIFRLSPEEVFVDVGAYNGDTIRQYLALRGSCFRQILALEPDPENFRELGRCLDKLPPGIKSKIRAKPLAAGAECSSLRFQGGRGEGSSLDPQGAVEVQCVRLDELLSSLGPTFIKMDIEGAELEALGGARQTLRRHAPILAACAYHTQDHLWRIPLAIREIDPACRLFLRPHQYEGWDAVCYAVPPNRLSP